MTAQLRLATSTHISEGAIRVDRLRSQTILGARVRGSLVEGEGEFPAPESLYQAQRVIDALGETVNRLDFYSDGEGAVEFSADGLNASRLATVTSRPPFELLVVPDDLASTVRMTAQSTGAVAAFLAGGL